MVGSLRRPPLHDAILRPHEQAQDPHRQYARKAELQELAAEVAALEVAGVAPATTDALGVVRLAKPGETIGGAVAVRADDPRLTGSAHPALAGRDAPDAHPIDAITGLRAELDATAAYTHIQGSPDATWVVVHQLQRYPSAVAVIDSGGALCVGAVVHDSPDQLTISFGAPFSGRAEVR
jgi:hypothetical protein